MLTAEPRSEEVLLSDERALVARARKGSVDAFTALVRHHADNMRGVAWRLLGSQAAMDDALQDAYVKAWRSIGSFRGDAAFGSWLYRIVHTTALDHLRAVSRRPVSPLAEADGALAEDPAVAIARSLEVREALASLPPDQLAVVSLIDGEGRTYDDVASLLDVSAGTVASRLHRARATLRGLLAPGHEEEGTLGR